MLLILRSFLGTVWMSDVYRRPMFLAYLFYHPLDEWFTIIMLNLTVLSGVLTMFIIIKLTEKII